MTLENNKNDINNNLKSANDRPVGMRNLTNTCFMNSLLQSIYTLNLLRDVVLRDPNSSAEQDSDLGSNSNNSKSPSQSSSGSPPTFSGVLDTPAIRIWREEGYNDKLRLTCHFFNTLRDFWESKKSPLVPVDILKAMASKFDLYNDFGQQDSHEFLRQLFDAMRMEELDVIYEKHPEYKDAKNKIKKLRPYHYQSAGPTTFVDLLCEGMIVNVIICATCKQIYHVYEPFLDISLALQDENKHPKRRGFRQSVRESILGRPDIKSEELTVEDVVLSDTEDDAQEKESTEQNAEPKKRFSFRNSFSVGSTSRNSQRRTSVLGPLPNSPSPSPHQTHSQLAPSPTGSMFTRRLSKRGKNRRFSRSSAGATSVEDSDESGVRRSKRTIEDKVYTQKLFGDLTTPSTPQSTHSASMTELANEQTMTSPSSTPSSFRDGQSIQAANSQSSVLAALRQPPPPQSNDSSLPSSAPMSATPSSNIPKTGIEDAFERYAGIETLQNENEFHCHGCWKQQNEVQVEMIRRFKDSKRKESHKSVLGVTGMTPLKDEVKEPDTYQAESDVDEDSDAEDDDDITEKDWNAFYGDTVAYVPRKQQVLGSKALRRTLIAIAPPILVLHLKRFGSVGGFALSKIFDNINFPLDLDIGPYIAPEKPKEGRNDDLSGDDVDPTTTEDYKRLAEMAFPTASTKYRLRSTVNHCGRTMISGHYTAFTSREVQVEDEKIQLQWYWASDETIKPKTEEQFLHESFKNDDQNAYVLVYERI
ncbi:cysteine proteinase [Wallemia mellicola]|uniref:ubiquitinyl hydrolase 1 n=1 Tax=Wallemia mellicola TaxID=1708541 RepID=A0A4T0Q268_9BASI|nr:cysteine proteinase [Wallemia mellicola]TIC59518.1 cysteine proteinase [Wallemia mellicola]TIC67127.1 cysteine proteinase [Wallemia mellicola]